MSDAQNKEGPPADGDKRNEGLLPPTKSQNLTEGGSNVNVMLPIREFPPESETTLEVQAPPDFEKRVSITLESDVSVANTAVHRENAQSYLPHASTVFSEMKLPADETPSRKRLSSGLGLESRMPGPSVVAIHSFMNQEPFDPEAEEKPTAPKNEEVKSKEPTIVEDNNKPGYSKAPPPKPTPDAEPKLCPHGVNPLHPVPSDVRRHIKEQLASIRAQLEVVKEELRQNGIVVPKGPEDKK